MKVVIGALLLLAAGIIAARFVLAERVGAQNASPPTPAVERPDPGIPKDALDRRARSNAIMRAEHVPLFERLPVIESEAEVQLPSTEEIAMRAAALLTVSMKAAGAPQSEVDKVVGDYQLKSWFSPHEAAFIADANPAPKDMLALGWRIEAANALLWTLGYVDRLDGPRVQCDPPALAKLILTQSRAQFLAGARLRPKAEILDQADLIYRYRWALVDELQIKNHAAPAGLSNDIAMERHQAFNWLLYHAETPWDDISLDT